MQKAQQQHRERAGFALRMIRDFFIGNWRANKGWVFSGCKKLAFRKTLASLGQGAGPELVQWQELLGTRERLGLPQVRILLSLSLSIAGASLAEICDLLSLCACAGISYGPQG